MSNILIPPQRLPVRADFPVVQNMSAPDEMFETFEAECVKHFGKMPPYVIVAWPHKDPEKFSGGPDTGFVDDFLRLARERYPRILFFRADGLIEKHAIARALDVAETRYGKRQEWELSSKFQTRTLPPLKGSGVIILDDACETGSTFADFTSMLHHNGAHVLMGAVPSVTRKVWLQFRQTPEQDRRIQKLDADFRTSAKRAGVDMKPGECADLVEKALNKNGYSLRTLTPVEFRELREEFDPNYPGHTPLNFFVFLDGIGKAPKAPDFSPK